MRKAGQQSRPIVFEVLEARVLLSGSGPPLESSLVATSAVPAISANMNHNPSLIGILGSVTPLTVSTIPSNGDLNPYGLAFVPNNFATGGVLHPGDLLVSNFNDSANLQGTGTTITRITPGGQTSTFFQGPTGLGLTTALGVLRNGFVIVGNLPTLNGTGATAQQGSLIVLDKNGNQVAAFSNSKLLDGPWDMTIDDHGSTAYVFVSNVLTGTVSRLDLKVTNNRVILQNITQIASGYTHRTDPAALLVGPTGLVFDPHTGRLFVASTADNAVYSISNAESRNSDAGRGQLIYQDNTHLHGPLALAMSPEGNLIVANGDAVNTDAAQNSELVEFTRTGRFISQYQVDPAAGSAFGIALTTNNHGQTRFAAVDDNTNSVSIWTVGG